jgi:hypothetical protein
MTFTRLLTAVLGLSLAAGAQTISGPYVARATTTSATVLWVEAPATVRFGADPQNLDASVPVFQVRQATLSGLKPATTYHYEVPGAGRGSFTTPPTAAGAATGAGDYTFAVFGDNRTRHEVYRKVAAAIAAAKPAFIVHTGDQVADGRDPKQWAVFFDISKEMLRHTVFLPALGNHERNVPDWYRFYDQPRGYYSFDWGKAHWVILNSDVGNVASHTEGQEAYWREQVAWMEQDLEKNKDADYLFVAFHHPPYTAVSRRHEAAAKIAARLVPVFRKFKVHGVFGGHDHNYQRHVQDGIQYVVTGGGGAPLYEVDGPLPGITQKVESVENYVFAEAKGKVIRFEARTPEGRVIDKFEITGGKR